MKLKFIEATQNRERGPNHGKFAVGRMTPEERAHPTEIGFGSLLRNCGWGSDHVWVLDLQTGEGAWFKPGGYPQADLEKHTIWVCLLFEPFLVWLYDQDLTDLDALPALVELPDAPAGLYGHRRQGPQVRGQAMELVKTRWWHKCETGPGGCHAVSEKALVGLIEALGLPLGDIYDVPVHDGDDTASLDEDDRPPEGHVPCPDCGDDPNDWSMHTEHCPRLGTAGQVLPWKPGPWAIEPPRDFTKVLDRDMWRGRVLDAVLRCMAGKCVLLIPEPAEDLVNYLQVVRECVPTERIEQEFETITKTPVSV